MFENDLQTKLEQERQKLKDLEEKVERQKELDVAEALIVSLQTLEEMKQQVQSLTEQMNHTQAILQNADKNFNAIRELLEQHVAGNKEATDELLKYLKNWG